MCFPDRDEWSMYLTIGGIIALVVIVAFFGAKNRCEKYNQIEETNKIVKEMQIKQHQLDSINQTLVKEYNKEDLKQRRNELWQELMHIDSLMSN